MARLTTAVALLLLSIAAVSKAQNLPAWRRNSPDPQGHSASVRLIDMTGSESLAEFGYRCYFDADKFLLGNGSYFIGIDKPTDLSCMKDPIQNVSIVIDGKTYSNRFDCEISGGTVYLELGERSRADMHAMQEIDVAMDRSKSKEMIVTITDRKHYLLRGSLKGVIIRKQVYTACNTPR